MKHHGEIAGMAKHGEKSISNQRKKKYRRNGVKNGWHHRNRKQRNDVVWRSINMSVSNVNVLFIQQAI